MKINKTELTVLERIELMSILPQQANYNDLLLKKSITEKIGVATEDIQKYGIRDLPGGGLKVEDNSKVSFELDKLETQYIRKHLVKLDQEEKLTSGLLAVYDIFVKE